MEDSQKRLTLVDRTQPSGGEPDQISFTLFKNSEVHGYLEFFDMTGAEYDALKARLAEMRGLAKLTDESSLDH